MKIIAISKKKILILRILVWLIAEIALNLIGLDDLADYSEFVFEEKHTVKLAYSSS